MLDKVYELRKREREKKKTLRGWGFSGVLVFKVLSRCLCLANFNLFEVRLAKHLFLVPVELTSSYKCCLQKAVYQSHFIIYLNKYPRTSRFNIFIFLFCLCLSTDWIMSSFPSTINLKFCRLILLSARDSTFHIGHVIIPKAHIVFTSEGEIRRKSWNLCRLDLWILAFEMMLMKAFRWHEFSVVRYVDCKREKEIFRTGIRIESFVGDAIVVWSVVDIMAFEECPDWKRHVNF